MMRARGLIQFLVPGIILCFSCKKTDEIPPVITVSSPVSDSRFNVPDTLHVKAFVKDETALAGIKVVLLNSAYVPVLQTHSYTPESNSYSVSTLYPLSDIRLESGNYFLAVSATDGRNDVNEYIPVYLTEAPLLRTGIYLFSEKESSGQTLIFLADSAGNITTFKILNGDFLSAGGENYLQLLYSIGEYTGALSAMDAGNAVVKWSVPATVSPAPWYTSFLFADNLCYAATYNGEIRGYDNGGILRYLMSCTSGYHPKKLFRHSDLLAVDEKNTVTKNHVLSLYFLATETLKQQWSPKYEVTEIFSMDEDNLLLIGDSAGQSKLEIYVISANGSWEPHTLPSGKITSAVQADVNNYLLAHSSGIYRYDYSMNSLTQWRPEPADFLVYDKKTGEVFAVKDNRYTVYDFPLATPLYSVTAPDTISSLVILYNK